ncbi:MAG: aminotransferase class III-fold pyridoxal phosphate-dependent enzyme [Gemmobacter sp.]
MKDANFLKANNARSLWHPMTAPADSLANPPTIVVEAHGTRIRDIDGKEVVDGVGGLWNVNLGYSCQPVKDAIAAQLDRLPYYSIFRGTSNDAVIELAEALREFFAPDGLTRAFYTSGGGDSVETALRLARQYHKIRGEAGRVKFLSLKKGYHGTHFGGASVNGNANFRTMYEPLLPGCFHIPAPYTYRNPFNESDPARLAQLCLAALEDEIAFQGAGTIAAFIMEPVLGAGGVIPPHPSFMPGVAEICRRNGILLIADEVITAFGRTGAWSGSRLWGVQPDFMATAKAITNGYFPFGAVMIAEHVAQVFERDESGKAAIGHGYTYSGHPLSAAVALENLRIIEEERIIDHVRDVAHPYLAAKWAQLADHPMVGEAKLVGLMGSIALTPDKARRAKFAAEAGTVGLITRERCFANNLIMRHVYDRMIIAPPLVITPAEIDILIERAWKSLDEAAAKVRAEGLWQAA